MTAVNIARPAPSKLFIPALARFYAPLNDVGDLIFRLLVGGLFIPHGYGKLFVSTERFFDFFAKLGMPGVPMTYFIGSLEFFGGIAIVLGLLTRPIAFMLFVDMAVAALLVHLPQGWGKSEYVVTLAVISLALAIRGGGRWSADRALFGREF